MLRRLTSAAGSCGCGRPDFRHLHSPAIRTPDNSPGRLPVSWDVMEASREKSHVYINNENGKRGSGWALAVR